jgi:hypothetical protein
MLSVLKQVAHSLLSMLIIVRVLIRHILTKNSPIFATHFEIKNQTSEIKNVAWG